VARAADIDELVVYGQVSTINAALESVEFFARKGLLIPYVLKSLPSNAICEVIVGPRVSSDENTSAIENWLGKNGFKSVSVEASKITYQD
jgi:hypothetical protein